MTLFVDTSVLLALLDDRDTGHSRAVAAWEDALSADHTLITSNYVAVETVALAQRRFGMGAVRTLTEILLPIVQTVFVTPEEHVAATAALLAAARRGLSFVDCTSFEIMSRRGITTALTLDSDFLQRGFEVRPAPVGLALSV